MYNLHKYREQVRIQASKRAQDEQYAKWTLRHEQLKDEAIQKQKLKLQDFIQRQQEKQQKFVFEDDHYQQWRSLKKFRDIEDQTKFLGFKAFRHKPNQQMGRYFDERQRKQISSLGKGKQHLIESQIIPQAQRNRSLRCQGPLNPKIVFRDQIVFPDRKSEDKQFQQPNLRFSNVTDKLRIQDKPNHFDDKFQTLYKSFEMTKSKLGCPKIKSSSRNTPALQNSDFDMVDEAKSVLNRTDFYFEAKNPEIQPEKKTPQSSQTNSTNNGKSKDKTYFKLAKTMAMQGCWRVKDLLKNSQYERKKDLSNLNFNSSCENYYKRPIL